MAGLARQSPQPLPNLVVAQRVLDKMAAAALAWLSDETGEALVGLVEPGVHTNGVPGIYLLDTIAPDESALRMAHTFQQGDQYQDELLWWQQENWRACAVSATSCRRTGMCRCAIWATGTSSPGQ